MNAPHTNGLNANSGKGVNQTKKRRPPPKSKQMINQPMVCIPFKISTSAQYFVVASDFLHFAHIKQYTL